MLTKENCKYIASQVGKYCANGSDNLAVKNLKSIVKNLDTAIENLWNSLERGENTEMITECITGYSDAVKPCHVIFDTAASRYFQPLEKKATSACARTLRDFPRNATGGCFICDVL